MRSARLRLSIAALVLAAGPAAAVPLLPKFSADLFEPGAPINSVYFPLLPGDFNVLEGSNVDDEGEPFTERTERSFHPEPGPVILGVQTTTLRDRVFENGLLVEDTFDYHAQDKAGNVWYFGEDVTNFIYDDDGNLIDQNNESAWLAGVNGAEPGYIMPVSTEIGFNYYQEHAPEDEALDQGLTFAILDSLTVGQATYAKVLQVFETTELEPDNLGFKFYAPGVGMIREMEGLNEDLEDPELVLDRVIPLPAPLVLLLAGLAGLGAVARRRRATASGSPASSA